MKLKICCALLVVPMLVGAAPARAQFFDRQSGAEEGGSARDPVAGADAPDPGSLAIRFSKLEGRIREMTGQIEELQNANRKLVDQVQKFQADVDQRLSATGGAPRPKRADTDKPKTVEEAAAADPDPRLRKTKRDDSFDPDTAAANAPGKPKPLGTTTATPGESAGGAPMDLSGGKFARNDGDDTLAPTLRLPSSTPKQPAAAAATPGGTAVASTGPAANQPNTPRSDFDTALGLYRDKQYEDAERGFVDFIQKNPKSKLAADATYYLGESFAQRGRSREAAEQYLKISTEYSTSPRAPDAMLHLGMSLKALGAKEQACATFSEVTRKYPNAPAYVRTGAEREAKRAQC